MLLYFTNCRNGIIQKIDEALAILGRDADPRLAQDDYARRIRAYMLGGKMIRGALVRLGAELFLPEGQSIPSEALNWIGAAMEFFQAGLLAHDDIMDRDTVRRGAATIHWQYAMDAGSQCGREDASAAFETQAEALHYGESQGICAGDIAFFLGNLCLAKSGAGSGLLDFSNTELCKVGLAQMLDVRFGTACFAADPSREEIITIYRYKTGRYTFSLPLGLGARLIGARSAEQFALERYGECLGIVFQLKDDELGIWAPEAALGKSPGIDIRENKKTLHRNLFLGAIEQLPEQDRKRLAACFGNRELSPLSLADLRGAMERLGVREHVRALMQSHIDEARAARRDLVFARPKAEEALLELEQYSLDRGF